MWIMRKKKKEWELQQMGISGWGCDEAVMS